MIGTGVKAMGALALAGLLAGCSVAQAKQAEPAEAQGVRVLKNLGLRDIETRPAGPRYATACAKGEAGQLVFSGRNPAGAVVSGLVCADRFGSRSVRVWDVAASG